MILLTFILLFLMSFTGFLVSSVPVYFRCGAARRGCARVLARGGGEACLQALRHALWYEL